MTHHLTLEKEKESGAMATVEAVEHNEEKIFESEAVYVSPEDNKLVRRKADMFLLPLLCLIYALQFLDKTCMTYASVMGFRKDCHLTLSQYSWLGSIFYLGYLCGAYPMTLLQQRLPLAKFTAANIIIWGVVVTLMSIGKNFTGLMIIRFFLGFFEASITPALMIFTGQWYKAQEQGYRTGLWTSMNSIGGIVGGGIAYGFAMADKQGKLSIAGWKIIFIFLGVLTITAGMLFFALIPDTADKAWFLNEREKEILRARLAANQNNLERTEFKWYQVREALLDPFVWLYLIVSLLTCIPNGGFTNFFAILIESFGFSSTDTLLLGMANSWLAVWIIVFMFLGDYFRNRCAMSIVPLLVSTAGTAMVWAIPPQHRIARLMGYYMVFPYAVPNIIVLSQNVTNIAGRTKKTTANALFMAFYCAGNLIGPQTFRQKDAPGYAPALITVIVCNIIVLVLMMLIWFLYVRENKRRDKLQNGEIKSIAPGADLTDRENLNFRYTI